MKVVLMPREASCFIFAMNVITAAAVTDVADAQLHQFLLDGVIFAPIRGIGVSPVRGNADGVYKAYWRFWLSREP